MTTRKLPTAAFRGGGATRPFMSSVPTRVVGQPPDSSSSWTSATTRPRQPFGTPMGSALNSSTGRSICVASKRRAPPSVAATCELAEPSGLERCTSPAIRPRRRGAVETRHWTSPNSTPRHLRPSARPDHTEPEYEGASRPARRNGPASTPAGRVETQKAARQRGRAQSTRRASSRQPALLAPAGHGPGAAP